MKLFRPDVYDYWSELYLNSSFLCGIRSVTSLAAANASLAVTLTKIALSCSVTRLCFFFPNRFPIVTQHHSSDLRPAEKPQPDTRFSNCFSNLSEANYRSFSSIICVVICARASTPTARGMTEAGQGQRSERRLTTEKIYKPISIRCRRK